MAIFRFGGPQAGQNLGFLTRDPRTGGVTGGPSQISPASLGMGVPRPNLPPLPSFGGGGGTSSTTQKTVSTSSSGFGRTGLNQPGSNINVNIPGIGLLPPGGGGGTTTPGTPGVPGGPTAGGAETDMLRGAIRRARTLGAGERRDITDLGLEQGLGRSQGAAMERQRQREAEQITGLERGFQAEQAKTAREMASEQLRAQLDRERMSQQTDIERQRTALERELAERRFQQQSRESELERQTQLAMSGGGGSTRIGRDTGSERVSSGRTGSGSFSGFDETSRLRDEAARRREAERLAAITRGFQI